MTLPFDPRQRELVETKLPPEKQEHSIRVGELASRQGRSFATVGLLHDMLEDSDITLNELRAAGVTDAELTAIQLLTRGPEPYEEYIQSVAASGDRLAISVKICDLLDHLDPSLIGGLEAIKESRYLAALPIMLDALRTATSVG